MAFLRTFTALAARLAPPFSGRALTAWRRLRAHVRAIDTARLVHELPIRGELLSAAQMERHGKRLAQVHEISAVPAQDRLLGRLAENEAALLETCDLLISATAA